MSLFRQLKTQINDEQCLVGALKTLGYTPKVAAIRGQLTLRNYGSEKTKGYDVVLTRETTKLPADIGFKREADGTFTLGMDEYAIREFTKEQFLAKVKPAYLTKKAQRQAQKAGLVPMGKPTVGQDGKIRLQFQKA